MKYIISFFLSILCFAIIMLAGELGMYMESLMTVKTEFYFTFHRIVNCVIALGISIHLFVSIISK